MIIVIVVDLQNQPQKGFNKLTEIIRMPFYTGTQNEEKTDSKCDRFPDDTATVIRLLDSRCCRCRCLWRV